MTHSVQEAETPTDEELDAHILARLDLLGVDLSVLPEDDADAPADRRRILRSARQFLRSTPGAIADFEFDPAGPPPSMYPSEQFAWTRE
ncbi:MAG: hypothetical protein OEU54_14825 [Gemmatimonadota bacterium]|nr:hypothetical protein [Gemmatimonadota bacterium]